MEFNYFDIGIIVIMLITALIGFMRGLVWMAIFLATWASAILLAIKFKDSLADALPIKLGSEVAQVGLAALLIFLGVLIAGALINYLFSRAVAAVGLGTFDRILGTGLGLALGALAIALLTLLLSLTELPEQDHWKKSKLIPRFVEASEWLQSLVPKDLNNLIDGSVGEEASTTIAPSDTPEGLSSESTNNESTETTTPSGN